MKKAWYGVVAAAGVLAGVQGVLGQESAEAGGWTVEVTPYAWLLNTDGDITIGNQKVEVDSKFVDSLDELDLAGSLAIEARKDSLILWAEGDYFNLSDEGETPVGESDIDSESSFFAGGVGYALQPFCSYASMDVYAGVRYMDLDLEFSVPGIPKDASSSSELVDPVLGIRISMALGSGWSLHIPWSVSFGGDSDFVSDAQINAAYAFSETVSGRIGYRCLYYDFEDGPTDVEVAFNGFMLGLGFAL